MSSEPDSRLKKDLKAVLCNFAPTPSVDYVRRKKDDPDKILIHMSWDLKAIGSYEQPAELENCESIIEQRNKIMRAMMDGFEDNFLAMFNRLKVVLQEFGLSDIRIGKREVVWDSPFLSDFEGRLFLNLLVKDDRQ